MAVQPTCPTPLSCSITQLHCCIHQHTSLRWMERNGGERMESKWDWMRWLYSYRAISTPMTSVRFCPSPLCGLKRDNVIGVEGVRWLYSLRAPPLSPAPSLYSTAVYINTLP